VGQPVEHNGDRSRKAPERHTRPEIRAALLWKGRPELGDHQRIRDEKEDCQKCQPGKSLRALRGNGADGIYAYKRADEKEEEVEATEVLLELLFLLNSIHRFQNRRCNLIYAHSDLPFELVTRLL